MLVKFNVTEWRDTAFSRSDSEGSGSYGRPRSYSMEMTEEQITTMKEDGFVDVNGTELCIDYDLNKPLETIHDTHIQYDAVTLFCKTEFEDDDEFLEEEEEYFYDEEDGTIC